MQVAETADLNQENSVISSFSKDTSKQKETINLFSLVNADRYFLMQSTLGPRTMFSHFHRQRPEWPTINCFHGYPKNTNKIKSLYRQRVSFLNTN